MIVPPSLVGGPYRPPVGRAYRVGRVVGDRIRGDVRICGISDSPIPWPVAMTSSYARIPLPVVTTELERAVRNESVVAVMYHREVSRKTVWRWRHALRVGRFTPGTSAPWRAAVPKLHTPAARRRHRAAMARIKAGSYDSR